MESKIAIIYTTFIRDKLMYKTIQSIIKNWSNDYILLIGDQGNFTKKKKEFIIEITNQYKNIHYYKLDFDCGLSFARNFLVKKANKLKCKYCFLTADSIMFTKKYNLKPIIKFLETESKKGIIGFGLYGKTSWERNIELIPGQCFYLKTLNKSAIIFENNKFQPCEICKNFFLAKTECLINNKWDNQFKLLEHEDYFWRLKNSNKSYQVFYTDNIQGKYIYFKSSKYNYYRARMCSEFVYLLKKKYKIKRWIKHEII